MRSDSLISNFSVDALFFIIQFMSSKAILQIYEVTVKIRSVGAVRLDETWIETEKFGGSEQINGSYKRGI